MADGGFLIKLNGQEFQRCYAVAFNYDEWCYSINNGEMQELPKGIEEITLEVELVGPLT